MSSSLWILNWRAKSKVSFGTNLSIYVEHRLRYPLSFPFLWIFRHKMSWFAYLDTSLNGSVYTFIWYQLCQFMLNKGWYIVNLLCVLSKFNLYYRLSYYPNEFFLDDMFFSHLVGPSEQFGTQEKVTLGARGAGAGGGGVLQDRLD